MTGKAPKKRAAKKKSRKRTCFVIAPMGKPESEQRHRTERVFEDVIKPAVRKCGYSPVHAMHVAQPGVITSHIITHVVSDALVIADLTGGNANVFYELALRHAVGRPVVQLVAKGQQLPFNVRALRTIGFDINDVGSRKKAKSDIIKQIREVEKNDPPHKTPVSAADISPWIPSPHSGKHEAEANTQVNSNEEKPVEKGLKGLEDQSLAEALPRVVKYMKELLVNVRLLETPLEDFDTACTLVNNIPRGGYISATSSLQNDDADEHPGYRSAVNLALERNVTYRKVICASPELWPDRRDKWLNEFTDKANLIRQGTIRPDAFRLLHYPSPMSVDVVISQNPGGDCREMVAGFAGGGGHGGFHTEDKRMVEEWLEVYLEKKIIAEAERHTAMVLQGGEECDCKELLEFLEGAREVAEHKLTQGKPRLKGARRRKNKAGNK